MRTIIRPIRCCRCRKVMSVNDRTPVRNKSGWDDLKCPHCLSGTFFLVAKDGSNCRVHEERADMIEVVESAAELETAIKTRSFAPGIREMLERRLKKSFGKSTIVVIPPSQP